MKAAIYDPYLDTLGGGERYMVTFASILRDIGWSVDIEFRDPKVLDKIHDRLGIDISNLQIVDSVNRGDGYDLMLWLSDGSIPLLKSRNNILHFQRPFINVDGKSLMNRMKFYRINSVIVNSQFTKESIDKEFPKESIVIYPPVDIDSFTSGKKENIILSVGRFSHLEQSKRQDVLVDTFKSLYDSEKSIIKKNNWRLIVAGGSDVGRTDYVDKLSLGAKGYPIEINENPSFTQLRKLYKKAKLYWTASGFGVDDNLEPNKVEHFGITVIEAMAAGLVVFAYNAGGHRESINHNVNGFVWSATDELQSLTNSVLEEPRQINEISLEGIESAKKYSEEEFKKSVLKLI